MLLTYIKQILQENRRTSIKYRFLLIPALAKITKKIDEMIIKGLINVSQSCILSLI
jgi:hypothetical protein